MSISFGVFHENFVHFGSLSFCYISHKSKFSNKIISHYFLLVYKQIMSLNNCSLHISAHTSITIRFTSCPADYVGLGSWQKQEILLSLTTSLPALGSFYVPNQWLQETITWRVKRPECKENHSSPIMFELRMHGTVALFSFTSS